MHAGNPQIQPMEWQCPRSITGSLQPGIILLYHACLVLQDGEQGCNGIALLYHACLVVQDGEQGCNGIALLHHACLVLQEGEQGYNGDSELRKEVRALQERRLLRTLAVVQDVSDSALALNDIRGGPRAPAVPCMLPELLHG